jgi:hypothetical protein
VWDPGNWSPDNLIMNWYGLGVGGGRVFGAFGYEYSFLDNHAGAADEAALRDAIMAEVDAGRPALAIGVEGPEECLIAGYREGGKVLVGQSYFQQDKQHYFEARDWYDKCSGLHVIGEKGDVPDPDDVLIDSLRWAVTMARTPEMSGRATGLAAYEAWAKDMLRDQDFPADDLDRVADNNMSIGDNFMILFDARRAGARYLERSAAQVGEEAAVHLRAAAELMDRESSTVWAKRDICPYLHPWNLEQIVDHDVRAELSDLILECRGLYAQAIEHIEQALAAETGGGGGDD